MQTCRVRRDLQDRCTRLARQLPPAPLPRSPADAAAPHTSSRLRLAAQQEAEQPASAERHSTDAGSAPMRGAVSRVVLPRALSMRSSEGSLPASVSNPFDLARVLQPAPIAEEEQEYELQEVTTPGGSCREVLVMSAPPAFDDSPPHPPASSEEEQETSASPAEQKWGAAQQGEGAQYGHLQPGLQVLLQEIQQLRAEAAPGGGSEQPALEAAGGGHARPPLAEAEPRPSTSAPMVLSLEPPSPARAPQPPLRAAHAAAVPASPFEGQPLHESPFEMYRQTQLSGVAVASGSAAKEKEMGPTDSARSYPSYGADAQHYADITPKTSSRRSGSGRRSIGRAPSGGSRVSFEVGMPQRALKPTL